jgi:hypothetical protein
MPAPYLTFTFIYPPRFGYWTGEAYSAAATARHSIH